MESFLFSSHEDVLPLSSNREFFTPGYNRDRQNTNITEVSLILSMPEEVPGAYPPFFFSKIVDW